ncbi:MAG: RluA family pseudouridine synthase [Candidatus Gracilibacteria bacterium]|nr:RluA family pseudouridine synthase [Candidatus Gracilibacteria bacterium]
MLYSFCILSDKQVRVDIYLSALFQDFSRSYIQKMIDRGQVSVNSKIITKNIKIKPRDEIIINIINESIEVNPQDMNLDIIYEDENLLIINKDPFLNVHPVPGEDGNKNTLVNGILYHCKGALPCISGVERPGIVHRLDKDTSGIILIAKTDSMMSYLSGIIKDREITKNYIAIVSGLVKESEFKIESFIGRDPNDRLKMTTKNPINPKLAISYGKLLGYIDNKYSVLKINIKTGRTHQIRVHLSSIGFPILGDKVYGNKSINDEVLKKYGLQRQALHAYELDFNLYGKSVNFKANLKTDMKKIIGDLIF